MRTTIDLPEDLHRIATSLARHNKRSLGQVVAELMRRGLDAAPAGRVEERKTVYRIDEDTGLPVILGATRVMTDDDVRALEDEP
ncbi:antitoxin [Luteimonas marina]|uniref:Antitoxin n=1 Tax=Luteimonas marina TaxID=488485 RepID=A0A5C5U7L9_9GAMM|nr:antitoxin [Luteimonas marina]TWT22421.1 antitoxin [Luteimonas marina]